jgi:tRNA A37 methylthiotransferase MiaB
MSVEKKNFVVSFRNDSSNINAIMEGGYGKNIMDIMIAINTCGDFEEANKQKIPYIQDFIYKNMKHIDFLIYLYGHTLVIQDYINRFGPIVYSPILDVDFATIIIDNIIVIYEAREFAEDTTSNPPIDSRVVKEEVAEVAEVAEEVAEYDMSDYYDSYTDEDEDVLTTSQIIYKYDNKLTEEDIIKFLSEN